MGVGQGPGNPLHLLNSCLFGPHSWLTPGTVHMGATSCGQLGDPIYKSPENCRFMVSHPQWELDMWLSELNSPAALEVILFSFGHMSTSF